MKTPAEFQQCAEQLKALADPDRLRIVARLFAGECCVTQLANDLNEDVAKVSHHLGVLRNMGLVETHRQGKFIFYQLNPRLSFEQDDDGLHGIDLGCCRLGLREDGPNVVQLDDAAGQK